jgi:predicted nucleic acid-binding protein
MSLPPVPSPAIPLAALRGTTVGLDTAPLIYYIEQDATFLGLVEPFFEAFDRGDFTIVTSIVTLLEVLVGALRKGDVAVAARYRSILLGTPGLAVYDVDVVIAEEAARIRAGYRMRGGSNKNIKAPDGRPAGGHLFLHRGEGSAGGGRPGDCDAADPGLGVRNADSTRSWHTWAAEQHVRKRPTC